MKQTQALPMGTLLLLISFASVNAVLPTPGLQQIAVYFHQNEHSVQLLMTFFLWGYALGQLIYGPLANRFGRKPALYAGLALQLVASLLCLISGKLHLFNGLVAGRFLMALGAGVGLKMTFTLINECYDQPTAAVKTAWLVLGFAFIPGIMVSISGFLMAHFSWFASFYLALIYGGVLMILVRGLPETQHTITPDALHWKKIVSHYHKALLNPSLLAGAFAMGSATCFVYLYATLSPLISINGYGMDSASYGLYNLIPTTGLVIGCMLAAKLGPRIGIVTSLLWGCVQTAIAIGVMIFGHFMHLDIVYALFIPMAFLNIGLSFIIANASSLALSNIADKSNASALLNFINMGMAALVISTTQSLTPTLVNFNSIFTGILMVLSASLYYSLRCTIGPYQEVNSKTG